MKIGIIGKGVVGTACGSGLTLLGHDVAYHDIKLNTTIDQVLDTELTFICVPTPSNPDGSCDISKIIHTVEALKNRDYQGIIAIKSTVPPGTTESLIEKYSDKDLCYVPEFLREHSADEDFVKNHSVLAVGCISDRTWHKVCEAHDWIPKNAVRMLPAEAEILKYFSNSFNALRVVFANAMHSICEKYNGNYDHVLETYLLRNVATADYMKCSGDLRGYGGLCLPKDVRTVADICKKLDLPFDLFKSIDHDNSLLKPTVFPGMRK